MENNDEKIDEVETSFSWPELPEEVTETERIIEEEVRDLYKNTAPDDDY